MRNIRRCLCALFCGCLLFGMFAVGTLAAEPSVKTVLALDFQGNTITFDEDTKSGAAPRGVHIGGNIKFGSLTVSSTMDGNDYYKYWVTKESTGADPYGGFYFKEPDGSRFLLAGYSYVTVDLDITTETLFPEGINLFLCARNSSGGLVNASQQYVYLKNTTEDGADIYANGGKTSIGHIGGAYDWAHLTWVLRIDNKTPSASEMLLYCNGDFLYRATQVFKDSANYIDTVRFGLSSSIVYPEGRSLCFDNVCIRGFESGYSGALSALFTPDEEGNYPSLTGNADSVYTDSYELPHGQPVARLGEDTYFYDTPDAAFAAAEPYDTVTLYTDVSSPLVIDKPIIVRTQGYAFSYTTSLTVTPMEDAQGLACLFSPCAPQAQVTLTYAGESVSGAVPVGQAPLAVLGDVPPRYERDGVLYTLTGWRRDDGEEFAVPPTVGYAEIGNTYTYTALFSEQTILFSYTDAGGQTMYAYAPEDFPAAVYGKPSVEVRLYGDLTLSRGIYLMHGASLTLILDGHRLTLEPGAEAYPFAALAPGASLTLVSGKGASVFAADAGAPLLYLTGDGARVQVSGGESEFFLECLVDGVHTPQAEVAVNGGTYRIGEGGELIHAHGYTPTLADVTCVSDTGTASVSASDKTSLFAASNPGTCALSPVAPAPTGQGGTTARPACPPRRRE